MSLECGDQIAQELLITWRLRMTNLTSYGTLIVWVYVADAFDVGHLVDVPARSAEIEKAFGVQQQTTLSSAGKICTGKTLILINNLAVWMIINWP